MRDLKNKLIASGKGFTNIQSRRIKSFGYQVLGFGAGGGGAAFVRATGGTITCSGDYKIHTFTGPGTFCVSCAGEEAGSNSVSYAVVAGGGGGGVQIGGGAGAGGYREGYVPGSYTASPLAAACSSLPVSVQGYPITVGAGGAGGIGSPRTQGVQGASAIFSCITSAGGGWAGSGPNIGPGGGPGTGGSGGGGSGYYPHPGNAGGAGNTPPTTPAQGTAGGAGAGSPTSTWGTGGGGGATVVGTARTGSNPNGQSGPGGAGAGTGINPSACVGTAGPCGSLRYFAGGGGGGAHVSPCTVFGVGGVGGGGDGLQCAGSECNAPPGTVNTGGGGGGAGAYSGDDGTGGTGGSGIVIIRYKFQ